MRSDWIMVQLGDIADIARGGSPRPIKKYITTKQNGINWIKIGDVDKNTKYITKTKQKIKPEGLKKTRLVKHGDLILSNSMSFGRPYMLKINGAIHDGWLLLKLKNKKKIWPDFLYQALGTNSSKEQYKQLASGGVVKNLNSDLVKGIKIPLAPLPEQKAIVQKIENLFKLIDESENELKSAKEKIKIYRQSVLKKAFEGKLTHKWRNEKNISHFWDEKTVKNSALNIQYGYTKSATKEPVGPKFLRITDIQNNSVNWSDVPFVRIDDKIKKKYLLKEGDLVFARTGATVGKSFLIQGNIPESVYASYLIRVRFPKDIFSEYVAYYFQSPFYWEQVKNKQVGTGQPNVNGTNLGTIKIPIPSFQEQSQIVKKIESIFSHCDKTENVIEQNLKNINSLRQSILKKSFSGNFLSKKELEACYKSPGWKSAKKLLQEIQKEKNRGTKNKQENLKFKRKRKAV